MSDYNPDPEDEDEDEDEDDGSLDRTSTIVIAIAVIAVILWALHDNGSSDSSNDPTARCVDGSTSYSQTHQGTCSHHGGVAQWLDDGTSSGGGSTDVEGPDVCYGRGGAYSC